jgi:hypothetical protein
MLNKQVCYKCYQNRSKTLRKSGVFDLDWSRRLLFCGVYSRGLVVTQPELDPPPECPYALEQMVMQEEVHYYAN